MVASLRSALLSPVLFAWAAAAPRADVIVADFEGPDFAGWTISGTAFGRVPHRVTQGFVGHQGKQVVSSLPQGKAPTGQLTSSPFKIQRPFLSLRMMGERDQPAVVGVELLVDGKVVRAASATAQYNYPFQDAGDAIETLFWRTWDVRALEGRTATLRLNDLSKESALSVDEIVQTDTARSTAIDASVPLDETYRPQFHYTARAGWLNDPHGLLFYRGTWHMSYQHVAPGSEVLVWGHAVSPDLVRWRFRPDAVSAAPLDNCASGSGMVDRWNASGLKQGDHDPLLYFFTRRPPGPKQVRPPVPTDLGRMTQQMAYSIDGGDTWKLYEKNPVLVTPDYRDRDPKVIYHEPSRSWFLLLSLSRNNVDREAATYGVFKSPNLKDWKLVQELGPSGWYWECPDLFEMPVQGDAGRKQWLLLKGSGDYYVGQFDGNGFHAESGPFRTKFGGNYYATQTFQDAPQGRRVQVGWMNTGEKVATVNAYPGMPFNQQMSFPREITLRATPQGPRLFREPIREIEQLYVRKLSVTADALTANANPLAGIDTELLDLDMEIAVGDATRIVLTVRGEKIVYDVAKQSLNAFKSTAPLSLLPGGRVHLRVLIDRTSIEAFGNHGTADISGIFFPDPAERKLSLQADGTRATVTRLAAHELGSIWKGQP